MDTLVSILGLSLILVAIAFYVYLCNTPLDIPRVFRNKKNKPKAPSVKFQHEASSAPDLLFGDNDYQLPKFEQIKPKPSFTMPTANEVQPTAIQQELAQIFWYKNQLSTVFRDDKDMVVIRKGKNVGVIRCIEKGRIHTGHIEDMVKLAKQEKVRTVYLLAFGKVDRAAFKLAVRKNVRFITKEKLDALRAKVPMLQANP